jgi:RimJ/RimL family protein N-acetyltransferase
VEVRVRPASREDIDVLASVVERANATYREWAGLDWSPPGTAHERTRWRDRLDDPVAWNAVAEAAGVLVGCVSFTAARMQEGCSRRIPGVAHLSRMFVVPEFWGHGVGRLLLSRAVAEMHHRGYERAQLFTAAENVRSRRFYERNGWSLGEGTRRWQGLLLVQYRLSL